MNDWLLLEEHAIIEKFISDAKVSKHLSRVELEIVTIYNENDRQVKLILMGNTHPLILLNTT